MRGHEELGCLLFAAKRLIRQSPYNQRKLVVVAMDRFPAASFQSFERRRGAQGVVQRKAYGTALQPLKGITIPVKLTVPFTASGWKIDFERMVDDLTEQKIE